MTRKIGLMGGTYNPIHNGHLNMIRQARDQFDLDQIWLIPTGDSPHKGISGSLGRYDRLRMCQLAVEGMRGVRVSDWEIRRAGKSYSYLTLEELKRQFPEDELYYIIGEDSLDLFFSWAKPDRICQLATILVACRSPEETLHAIAASRQISPDQADTLTRQLAAREGKQGQSSKDLWSRFPETDSAPCQQELRDKIRALSQRYHGSFRILDCGRIDISSSKIRQMEGEGADLSPYVPSKVLSYIREHALYREENTYDIGAIERDLAKSLSTHRYQHTLGVMHTACALAMAHSYPLQKARIAGLLHDCAKNLSNEKLREIACQEGIPISKGEERAPQLLHAKVGAHLAREVYGVDDPAVLRAIRLHTTGSPAMGLLDKIIFVADYIEPGRDRAPRLADIRQVAFHDLDLAVCMILEDTIAFLEASKAEIDQSSRQTLKAYQDITQTRRFQ